MGETVKTLVHYPTQARDGNLLLSLKELRTRGSQVSAPRNENIAFRGRSMAGRAIF